MHHTMTDLTDLGAYQECDEDDDDDDVMIRSLFDCLRDGVDATPRTDRHLLHPTLPLPYTEHLPRPRTKCH